jgi:hypothetical protein
LPDGFLTGERREKAFEQEDTEITERNTVQDFLVLELVLGGSG